MAGFRSLPVSSVLVDSSCRLIDINLQAIFQFNVGRSEIQKEEQFISRIENFQAYVANLSRGVDLYKEKTSTKKEIIKRNHFSIMNKKKKKKKN